MRDRLRKFATYPNIIATLALLLASTGTSFAAVKITGAKIKDNTVLSIDVKNLTLASQDFSAAAQKQLVGPTGDRGSTGPKGSRGPRGETGDTGDTGDPAHVRGAWSWYDSGYMTSAPGTNNPTANDWNNPAYNSGNVAPANAANAPHLDTNGEEILDLSPTTPAGSTAQSTGPLTLPYTTNIITATATVTLLYNNTGDGGSTYHTRAMCWIESDGGLAAPNAWTRIGAASWASSDLNAELESVSIVANVNKGLGTYNFRVVCQDADQTGAQNRWWAVRANMAIWGTERL